MGVACDSPRGFASSCWKKEKVLEKGTRSEKGFEEAKEASAAGSLCPMKKKQAAGLRNLTEMNQ